MEHTHQEKYRVRWGKSPPETEQKLETPKMTHSPPFLIYIYLLLYQSYAHAERYYNRSIHFWIVTILKVTTTGRITPYAGQNAPSRGKAPST